MPTFPDKSRSDQCANLLRWGQEEKKGKEDAKAASKALMAHFFTPLGIASYWVFFLDLHWRNLFGRQMRKRRYSGVKRSIADLCQWGFWVSLNMVELSWVGWIWLNMSQLHRFKLRSQRSEQSPKPDLLSLMPSQGLQLSQTDTEELQQWSPKHSEVEAKAAADACKRMARSILWYSVSYLVLFGLSFQSSFSVKFKLHCRLWFPHLEIL